jgi:transposase-like protein
MQNNKVVKNRIVLAYCPFCGQQNVQSHMKYNDRCDACGKRYAKYSSYRSMQKKEYSPKRDVLLADLISEYRSLMKQGFKVPAAIKRGDGLR